MTDYVPWTEEDEKRLKDLRPDHTYPQLSKILNRSETAVRNKVGKMGLPKKRIHQPEWPEKALGILRANWSGHTGTEISRLLEKEGFSYSRAAVIGKANRKGLVKGFRPSGRTYKAPGVRRFSFEDLPA